MTRLGMCIALILIALATVYVLRHAGEKPRLVIDPTPLAAQQCPPPLGHFASKHRRPMEMS